MALTRLTIAWLWVASLGAPALAAEIGQPLPDFTAIALDGSRFSFAEATKSHRAVVVLFLSTVCPYANYFGDHIRDLDREYRQRGVFIIGIDSNQFETVEEMGEHAREHGYTFPLARDEGARIADVLGARRTPEAFLVDGAGKLRYRGWVKSKRLSPDLQRAIDSVLAGREVRLARTNAFGCAIDRN